MATLNFNANNVEPSAPIEALPAGKYTAEITASESKSTKSGNGSFLELEFTVLDGEYKGRKFWDRLNLQNPNSTAVKIAQQNLSAICRAVGVMQPQDSVELHNLPLAVTLKCKKREDTGELTNEVKGYAKRESMVASGEAPQADNKAAPWQRN